VKKLEESQVNKIRILSSNDANQQTKDIVVYYMALINFSESDDKEQFWSEGGNIMFCEICGNYIR